MTKPPSMSERQRAMEIPPCLYELSGSLSARGTYLLKITTRGPIKARDVRNLIMVLELTASWIEEDENADVAKEEFSQRMVADFEQRGSDKGDGQ